MSWIIRASFLWMLFIPLVSCAGEGKAGFIQAELDNMVKSRWGAYAAAYPGFKGGLALRITSPAGEFFTQTGFDGPAAPHSHFRAASTTKTFTAAAIMLLHQQGRLDINHPVTQSIPGTDKPYLPDSDAYNIPYKSEITIKLLLQHRAGVFDVSNSEVPADADAPYAGKNYIDYTKDKNPLHTFTFDELAAVVASNRLSHLAPNAGFHYSDTGYSLLGKIIERVSGLSYGDFVSKNLLAPNGMADSNLPWRGSDTTLPEPFIRGYTLYGGEFYATVEDNMSCHVAEGNLITTPADLSVWVRNLFTGRAGLKPETAALMTEGAPPPEGQSFYGLGVMYTSGLGYGHNGGHIGYFTIMRYDQSDDVALVMTAGLMNDDDPLSQQEVMYDICRQAKQIVNTMRQYR